MNEFELINYIKSKQKIKRKDVIVGILDDAAIVNPPDNKKIAISTDTLLEGVHFQKYDPPELISYKAIAVNLSDMAAIGADPAWITLSLTIPEIKTNFIKKFTRGLFNISEKFSLEIIGGDICRGPFSITIQIQGFVKPEKYLLRKGAKFKDDIYVSGSLGKAAIYFFLTNKQYKKISSSIFLSSRLKYFKPKPRINLGKKLIGIANSAIDISDGLSGDLQHILNCSNVGANIFMENIPIASDLNIFTKKEAMEIAISGGEDYELCFTAPSSKRRIIKKLSKTLKIPIIKIGEIISELKTNFLFKGYPFEFKKYSYQHFY